MLHLSSSEPIHIWFAIYHGHALLNAQSFSVINTERAFGLMNAISRCEMISPPAIKSFQRNLNYRGWLYLKHLFPSQGAYRVTRLCQERLHSLSHILSLVSGEILEFGGSGTTWTHASLSCKTETINRN